MHAHALHALQLPRTPRARFPDAWRACLLTALGGSALAAADLAFAALFWSLHDGTPAIRIPQSIAAWVLGRAPAHAGGLATALAGALLYACVVSAMVEGYVRLSASRAAVRRLGLAGGVAYGCAMYGLLFRLVLPAWSAAPPPAVVPGSWTLACLGAYAGIGAGCFLIARVRGR